ncbi:MAG: hypothetical protein R3336_02895 [Phycisphaeraceae bacterium]|nr:hypothetical protein [Phycisphaeraceae bacterium]
MMRSPKWICSFLAALGLAVAPGLTFAGDDSDDQPNPYAQPDESWISLSGTAVEADDDSFELDYGEGTVLVEMDDWDWYGDNYAVIEGDEVTVYGKVDDSLYELTSIEADQVYVKSLGTYFFAPEPADEEGDVPVTYSEVLVTPVDLGDVAISGTVTSVDGREFTIDTGDSQLTVDTIEMPYNPMDDKGFQRIDTGDRVSVLGEIEHGFFQKRELHADSIVTLEREKESSES